MKSTIVLFAALAALSVVQAHENKACAKDVRKFCKGVKGEAAVIACLKEHKSELSKKCKKSDHLKD